MLNKIALLIFALLCINSEASCKVLIITHAYNRPDFIEIQARTFRKFLSDDFEFVVYNDATDPIQHDGINQMCQKCGITCIIVPQEIHLKSHPIAMWNSPNLANSKRHAECIQYSLDTLGYDHRGIVALFDSDLFLIRPLSIKKLLKNFQIASLIRTSTDGVLTHLWPGLSFLQMNTLPRRKTLNYDCGIIDTHIVDTGGNTYYYLRNHPRVRLKPLGTFPFLVSYTGYDALPLDQRKIKYQELGFNEKEAKLLLQTPHAKSDEASNHVNIGLPLEFAYKNHFMHYRGGSFGDLPRKSQLVHEFINDILAN